MEAILNEHPYLVEPVQRSQLEAWLRDGTLVDPDAGQQRQLIDILARVGAAVAFDLDSEAGRDRPHPDVVSLPGDRGGVLFRISNGPGPVFFATSRADLALTEGLVSIPVAASGTTWALLTLRHVPDGLTSLYAAIEQEGVSIGAFRFQVTAPVPGRLKLTVLSDDTGEPTPAMIQMKWLFDDSLRAPDNAVDFTPQFDAQAAARNRPEGSRRLNLPGLPEDDYWVVPGPIDMMIPAGRWQISVLRGLEHLPVVEEVRIESGQTTVATTRPRRWVDMAARGWYSGDDHVHARVMSRRDADNLLTWALAEDLRVVNLLEMGDHARTFFQQREFGPDSRILSANTMLVPGQEDPRISHLGHTIALNIRGPVRDTSRYYLHDLVYDEVHQLGGLYGYAHVNRGLFSIHRDLTLNAPLGKIDFVELLQFHQLGTALYYEFLDLGYKLTASAGSDVPWGATMGEVRVYAFLDDHAFADEEWFAALAKGRTFVTNGPMIEFSVNDALPGDEIQLTGNATTLRVKARAWGHPDRLTPIRLEIVRFGEVIRAVTGTSQPSGELELEFDLDADWGCWLAARASADDGSNAHTTPIYVARAPFRSWDFERVPDLIDLRMQSLDEIEEMVDNARPEQPVKPDAARTGALAGAWYGNADLTRPEGVDTLHLPEQTWPVQGGRGGEWSAQWRGVLTVPKGSPEKINLFLDSAGPSSLSIDGKEYIAKGEGGEASTTLTLRPDAPHEVSLTYVNRRSPQSYLSLRWSADGMAKQPVPAAWFSHREKDRLAFRFAEGTRLDLDQLADQADELLVRVGNARRHYENLRMKWIEEKLVREEHSAR